MTDRTAYKHRVTTVRGRARAQLAAIRKERLSRRTQVPYVAEATPPEPARPAEAASVLDTPTDPRDLAVEVASRCAVAANEPDPVVPAWVEAARDSSRDMSEDAREADDDVAEAAGGDTSTYPVHLETDVATEAANPEREPVDPAMDIAMVEVRSEGHVAPDATVSQVMQSEDEGWTGAAGTTMPLEAARTAPVAEPEISESQAGHLASCPTCAPTRMADPTPPRPDEPSSDAAEPEMPEATAAVADNAPPASTAQPDDCSQSDLFQIPGIGSGLVWMMQSAGIQCLDDLARAQTRDLAERLGMISRLLDLDYFVEFARNRDARP